jgi:hypothetical protein
VLEEASGKDLEMRARDAAALAFTLVREAKPEVSEHYLTSFPRDAIEQQSQAAAKRNQHRQRQKMEQPDEGESGSRQHADTPGMKDEG